MFEVTARLKIREGELDGFRQQAAEVMRQAKEKDTKTLRYDWFLSLDGTSCEVREGYVDADALLEHSEHVGAARAELFRDFAYDHDMTLYGEPSPALAETMEAMAGAAKFTTFRLVQGLDAEAATPAPHDTVFEATARLRIRAGELEAFRQQVAEILRQTDEQETKPLRYDWFLSEDGTECEVREAYVDADRLLQQQHQIREAKMALFRDCVAGHTMTFYGELSPALVETLETMGTTFTQFRFFQGLDAGVDARAGVPA